MPDECLVCNKHRGELPPPGGAIYEDDLVFASHMYIPEGEDKIFLGALFLEPKRHVDGMEDLTDEEAQAIGLHTTRLSRALKQVTQAEHVYIFRFGHHVDHLHIWIMPRYPGTPKEYWGLKVDEWPLAPHGGEEEVADLCEDIHKALVRE